MHLFEKAGLGKAPFTFISMDKKSGPIVRHDNGITITIGSPGQPMGVCDYCGTCIKYCCTIESADGKHFIVGTTCVEKTSDSYMANAAAIAKRDLIGQEKAKERRTKIARQRFGRAAAIAHAVPEFVKLFSEIRAGKYNDMYGIDAQKNFFSGTFIKLMRYPEIYPSSIDGVNRQIEYFRALVLETAKQIPVITGRIEIVGTVKSIKETFNSYGSTWKMLVMDDRGFKVWGTIADSIYNVGRGDRVVLTATVTASDNDKSFGFYKRPAKARMLPSTLSRVCSGE